MDTKKQDVKREEGKGRWRRLDGWVLRAVLAGRKGVECRILAREEGSRRAWLAGT